METKKRRVLLKISGEAFGAGGLGVNPDVVSEIAKKIAEASASVEIAIVVGGGNFFREPSFQTEAWIAVAPTTWECSEPS